MLRLLVINGPNLNLLGLRETSIYGSGTLQEVQNKLTLKSSELGCLLDFVQSNHEGALVDAIQGAPQAGYQGIVINPGAYGHTSIALRDALLTVALPFVEVHISNIYAREEFRHKSLLSDIASGVIVGTGQIGYELAIRALVLQSNQA
ncbi:MAG: type II 3-dehydroquinate dehydratase [Candidatus Obscuribacter sp.]|nr:type II 3-dehydroquinate dehydratase [Candidatus Obscuribacter sp.]